MQRLKLGLVCDAFEVNEASIVSNSSGDAFTANAYYDGAWKYKMRWQETST